MRKGVRLPLETLRPYLFTLPEPGVLLNLTELFRNTHPVDLEVGFGKGAFLVETAPKHPARNYLGIEIDRGLQLYVANRITKRLLTNVRVASGDAGRLLKEHLPAQSLSAVHVYFPDPWWKTRHRRRRVFNETFVTQCARVLQPGGHLHFATDVAEYFQVMLGLVTSHHGFAPIHVVREEGQGELAAPQTNYEKKAMQQGRPVWRAGFILSPVS